MSSPSLASQDPSSLADGGPEPSRPAVAFRDAARFWLKLGFISFGGPAGQIALMHRELVERRRWISEARFLHALNYCMLLPGPEAQQLATYIGWLLHKVRGGLVAGVLFVLPSIFVLLGLSWAYAAHGETTLVAGLLYGFRPVVVAIVLEAAIRIGRRAIRSTAHWLIAAGAFLAIFWLDVPFPLIVLGAGLVGYLGARLWPIAFAPPPAPTSPAGEAAAALAIDDQSAPAPHTLPSLARLARVLGVCGALWLAGWVLLSALAGPSGLLPDLYAFFTKAAFVTFGGAYAVLAYVAQEAVHSFGWLDAAQTVDGLALAETTPGPLIMVVQFVGFMAGWNHPGELTPLVGAIAAALVTTFATFLPCFLFIFLGAPYIEVLRSNRSLGAALTGVTAAVVGVVANLALVFGGAVLLPPGAARVEWPATAIVAAAFIALRQLDLDVVWVVVGGGLVGLLMVLLLG